MKPTTDSRTDDTERTFKIRSYGRMELALAYCPTLCGMAAYRKLESWIDRYPGLRQQLRDVGYSARRRSYTPVEVKLIVEAIGEP